jgi:hypothetical protein
MYHGVQHEPRVATFEFGDPRRRIRFRFAALHFPLQSAPIDWH